MRRLRLQILGILIMLTCTAWAQSSVISIVKESQTVKAPELKGKGGVIFRSERSDLSITTATKGDPVSGTPKKAGKLYEYELQIEISKTGTSNNRVFTVAQQGTAISEKTGQVKMKADQYQYFKVEMVKKPIVLEASPDAKGYFQSGCALIEINSEIPMTLTYDKNIKKEHKAQRRNRSGAYVDSLVIVVDSIKKVIEEDNTLNALIQTENEKLDQLISNNASEDVINTQDSKVKALEKKKDIIEAKLSARLNIELKGEGTNTVIIEPEAIRGLNSKDKLCYNVLVVSKEVKVFKTKYEEMVSQAESHMKNRDYATAQQYYTSAMTAEGATATDKEAAKSSAEKMGRLATVKAETDKYADKLYEISQSNEKVNKEALFNLIDQIAERYDALYNETGDQFYKNEASNLRAQKTKVGFVVKGRFVISEYKGGRLLETPVTNVKIYGSSDVANEKMKKKSYIGKGTLITTVTASDGRFSINLQPGQYNTLIFEANNSDIEENKYVDMIDKSTDLNFKVRFKK